MSRIDEIELRLAAATPGPWREGRHDMQSYHPITAEHYTNIYVDGTMVDGASGNVIPRVIARAVDDPGEPDAKNNKADAAFIANAPADLRYLLGEVKRLREALEAIRDHKLRYWFGDGKGGIHYTNGLDFVRDIATAALLDERSGT